MDEENPNDPEDPQVDRRFIRLSKIQMRTMSSIKNYRLRLGVRA